MLDRWNGAPGRSGRDRRRLPQLLFLVGPNTGLGHSSMVYMIESVTQYAVDAIKQLRAGNWASVDVKPEAQRAYNDRLQQKVEGTVWQVGGCKSWYQNDAGRNTALWPDFTFNFRKEVAQFDASNYAIEVAKQPSASREHEAPAPAASAVSAALQQGSGRV